MDTSMGMALSSISETAGIEEVARANELLEALPSHGEGAGVVGPLLSATGRMVGDLCLLTT